MPLFESPFKKTGSLWVKLSLPLILSLVFFIIAIMGLHLPFVKSRMLDQKKTELKSLCGAMVRVMESAYQMQQTHQISKKTAQQLVIRSLEKAHYGQRGSGYFWIQDLHPRMIMHPYRKDLNGKDVTSFMDISGKQIFVMFVEKTAARGEAFVSYYWQGQDRFKGELLKLSYARRFEPWGWIVGTGIFLDEIKEEVARQTNDLLLMVMVILASIFVLFIISFRQSVLVDRKLHVRGAFLEELFQQARNCVGLINVDGKVLRINKTALALMKVSSNAVEGKYFWDTPWWSHSGKMKRVVQKAVEEANDGKLSRFESKRLLADGSRQVLDCSLKPLYDMKGGIVFLLAEGNDITEIKQAEERLETLNRELEVRVKERTREIELSLASLRETQAVLVESEKMAALGGLVAGVAHEINTPLGIAVTNSTFLVERIGATREAYASDTMTRTDFEKFLGVAEEAAESMLFNLQRAARLIKSFKQVAVDQEVEEKRLFKVKEYLDEILLSMHSLFRHTRHSIQATCPDTLEIDSYPGALAQIFSNLIKNSLVHGFEHMEEGAITINVTPEENRIRFAYNDNGKGMTEEQRKRIFDPFYTTGRHKGGTGLGMHIVYNLVVQKLGGTIEVDTKPEEGVRILFTIPLQHKTDHET